ncbi:MAG: tetratricopeptide repeat protein [Limnoraphis sp. WC205]|nr:tetratricopeptide repeat protein [Limnoraphis sp. WC205]
MTANFTDWDVDLPNDPEEDYQAFIRGLRRREGFGLFFVECSPAEGERLIQKVKQDIPKKTIEVLRLTEPIDNLYTIVNDLPNRDKINVLFISGLEHSLYNYELRKLTQGWSSREKYTYSWKGVPPILSHLNQQRERFRDDFNICFVFLIPKFILNYFIHRAPDFFDWRSGFFELPTNPEFSNQRYTQLIEEGDFEKYKNLTPDEQREQFLEIQGLLAEEHLLPDDKVKLLFKLGLILAATEKYEEAIESFDKAIEIELGAPIESCDKAIKIKLFNDAVDLSSIEHNVRSNLGCYGETMIKSYNKAIVIKGEAKGNCVQYNQAIEIKPSDFKGNFVQSYNQAIDYNQAIEIKPDDADTWNNRGNALGNLGRYGKAVASYDKAIEIKPDDADTWNNRGIALGNLGRYGEAVASYEQAIKFKPDDDEAWYNRGIALRNLGRYEEAVASYEQAIKFKPDYYYAWSSRGNALVNLGRYEEAVASYEQAIKFKPDKHEAWNKRGNALLNLRRYEEAIKSYNKAIEIKPDQDQAWNKRGNALLNLRRYEEAIKSYNKAIEIKPDYHKAWYNRGYALGNLGRYEEAVASFDKAIEIQPDDADAWYNRGIALLDLGRYEEAVASFDKAIEIQPDYPYAWLIKLVAMAYRVIKRAGVKI